MPIVLANCLQVAIEGNQPDGIFANVVHIDMSGAGEDNATTAQIVLDTYITTILTVLYHGVVVRQAHWEDMSTSTGATGIVVPTTGLDVNGGVATEPMPPQVAYLAKLVTTSARGIRNGRMYLPGVRKDEVTDAGDVTDTTLAAVSDAVQSFISTVLAESGNPLAVLHTVGGVASMSDVALGFCERAVATQRRRLNR